MSIPKFKVESGLQLLARIIKRPALENFYPVLFESGPQYHDKIEISSDCNTSHIIIDLICEALLINDGAGVLFFNTDGNLDYSNLLINLRKKLKHRNGTTNHEQSNSELDILLKETIANFHLLEIYDASQLYATIYNLENILLEHSNITLVIFDTLTAFYWSEQGFKITKMDLYIKNLIRLIHKVTKEYKIVCVFTRPCYFTNKKQDNIDLSIPDLLNYRIQLLNNIDNINKYEVTVTTNKTQFVKYYHIVDNQLNWL